MFSQLLLKEQAHYVSQIYNEPKKLIYIYKSHTVTRNLLISSDGNRWFINIIVIYYIFYIYRPVYFRLDFILAHMFPTWFISPFGLCIGLWYLL